MKLQHGTWEWRQISRPQDFFRKRKIKPFQNQISLAILYEPLHDHLFYLMGRLFAPYKLVMHPHFFAPKEVPKVLDSQKSTQQPTPSYSPPRPKGDLNQAS